MSTVNRHIVATVVCGLILSAIISQANHYLAPRHVALWAGGLLVTFPALRLGFRAGLASVFALGLLRDALAPVPFGTHALLFAAGHAVIFNVRNRLPREETLIGVLVALLANLGLFLVLSFVRIGTFPAPGTAWFRLFADLLVSQVVVAAIAAWFLALQERALEIAGASLRAEQRGVK